MVWALVADIATDLGTKSRFLVCVPVIQAQHFCEQPSEGFCAGGSQFCGWHEWWSRAVQAAGSGTAAVFTRDWDTNLMSEKERPLCDGLTVIDRVQVNRLQKYRALSWSLAPR